MHFDGAVCCVLETSGVHKCLWGRYTHTQVALIETIIADYTLVISKLLIWGFFFSYPLSDFY